MTYVTRRSGLILLLLGFAGAVFFWLTDPRFGPAMRVRATGAFDVRHWLYLLRGSPQNVVDAANDALLGTIVGILASVTLIAIGGWLLSRRRI